MISLGTQLRNSWYVWLFPAFAIFLTAYLFLDHYRKQGPVIKISFNESAGLQAEKTKIRYRGVVIGSVTKIEIAEDFENVVVSAKLIKEAEKFASSGAKFWIVKPKVDFQGISGLETLFEGTYISAEPGKKNEDFKDEFQGQLRDESNVSTDDTVSYYLETPSVESINPGDSVIFRGLNIGTVSKINLAKSGQSIIVQINIQNKYVRLIRTNTVFWRKAGIQAKLGLFNSEIKINSLESILKGGIDVFTPNNPGVIANAQSSFNLLDKPPKDYEKWNPKLEKN